MCAPHANCNSEFESAVALSSTTVQSMCVQATRSMFGLIGAGKFAVDVLQWSAASAASSDDDGDAVHCAGTGILSLCDATHLVPVRAALTLLSTYGGKACRVTVTQYSPALASLASNSRTYFQRIVADELEEQQREEEEEDEDAESSSSSV
jgi:hypothetical protein